MLRIFLLVLATLFAAFPARAEMRTCETRINGEPVALTFDDEEDIWSSYREGWFTKGATCPGLVVLRQLAPDLDDKERSVFCAVWDEKEEQYTGFAAGSRDGYGRCRKPGLLCRGVKATAGEVMAVSGLGTQVQPAPEVAEAPTEPPGLMSILARQAGAVVLSGTASYVSTLLQGAGTAVAATVGGPVALAGAAVTVVAVGGALYMCG